MDQFSSEECRALCPKDTTAEQQLKALDFHGLMMNMAEIDTSTDHGKETLDIIKGGLKTELRKVPKDTKGSVWTCPSSYLGMWNSFETSRVYTRLRWR